jgi:RNA polymerase sigma factor (sigma-70 family)
MAGAPLSHVLRHVRGLAVDPSDRTLLERFTRAHDEAAFAELVRRHGPLVWGVCRRLLHREPDAEDAFQATFLVLARKAGTVRWDESAAGWLHEVARRTALKARAVAVRRREGEWEAQAMRPANQAAAATAELHELLDVELARLPDHYREPLLLCCVQGLSNEEAARRLGCPTGTIKSRLARGRELLRTRLVRRGVMIPGTALVALLAAHASAPPRLLADATVRAAIGFALAPGAVAVASQRAAILASAVLRGTSAAPFQVFAGLVVALVTLAAGLGALAHQAPVSAEAPPPPAPSKPAATADDEPAIPHDPLPPGALARLGTPRFRVGSVVYSVALSPDGKLCAGGGFGSSHVWDTATGKELEPLRLDDHKWRACVAFSADGKMLLTGDSAGVVRLRTTEGDNRYSLHIGDGNNSVRAATFSPDGKMLAAGFQDGEVRLFETSRGAVLPACRGHRGEVWSVAISPDSKIVASAGADGVVRLWDAATAMELRQLTGHEGEIRCVAFSPDGKFVASAGTDRTVRLWDATTGKEVHQIKGHTDKVEAVVFARDGKSVYSGGYDNTIRRWDVATGKEDVKFRRHQRGVMCLDVSGDGSILASGGWDGLVRLWSTADGKELNPTGGHQDGVQAVALLPGGRSLASVSHDGTLRQWDRASGRELRRVAGHQAAAWNAAFSTDGKRLAVKMGERTLAVWDAAAGKETRRFSLETGRISCLTLSADGKRIAAGSDSAIVLWDTATGNVLGRCTGAEARPRCLAISPDGKRLAGGGQDNVVRLWDASTGAVLLRLEGHAKPLDHVAFSPDGRLLATAANELEVRLWDVATGKELRRLPGHGNGVHCLAFSADGRTLAAAGWSPVIRLWEVATGRLRGRFAGHLGPVSALALTPDGRTLLSGGADTTVLLWDLTGRQRNGHLELATLADPELEAAWSNLGDEDAAKAYRAAWDLIGSPKQSLPLLRGMLRPAVAFDAARLPRLIAELDADDFDVRERATRALEEAGEQAEPALRRALTGNPSAEVRQRVEHLLGRLKSDAETPDRLRQERAMEVLEGLRTTEARTLLQELAKGAATARLTIEAQAALKRGEGQGSE